MHTVELKNWTETNRAGEEADVSLMDALNAILAIIPPQEQPRGMKHFKTYSRIEKAFKEAKETNILSLEDAEFDFLKEKIEKYIPASFGRSEEAVVEINKFLNSEET